MKLVVDTSIIIDYLRGGDSWDHVLGSVEGEGIFFLPTIVIFELFSGKSTRNTTTVQRITSFLNYFQKIELTESIAKRAGEIYRDLSITFQVPDYIIAASALEIGGTVITLNKRHFQQITGLSVYPLNLS